MNTNMLILSVHLVAIVLCQYFGNNAFTLQKTAMEKQLVSVGGNVLNIRMDRI